MVPLRPRTTSWATLAALAWLATLVLAPSLEAAIAFRSAASTDRNGQATSITISRPAGTSKGDLLVAIIAVRPSGVSITAPGGFTLVRRQSNTSGNTNALAVYQKVATSSEPASYTFSFSSNTGNAGGILAFTGVDNATPIHVHNGSDTTSSTTTFVAPSVTTSLADTMIVTAHEYASSDRWNAPSGMSKAVDVASLAVPNASGIAVLGSYRPQASAGASGTMTATALSNADTGTAITLALRPVVCGPAAANPGYFAATAQSGRVILYWSSATPVVVLRKATAFDTEAPADGVTYVVDEAIGAATVAYVGPAQGLTEAGLINGTSYHYKVFARDATDCYSSGSALRTTPSAGPAPAWSYTMAGGSMLNAGIAGDGVVYTSSNASAMVSVNSQDGTQSWSPLVTSGAIQSTLTWVPIDTGVQSVQSGTATLTTQTVLDVPISPVDLTRAVLFMTVSANSLTPSTAHVRGQLTSPTNLQFNRTAGGATVTVTWYVATFGAGVRVQRGSTTTTANPMNVPIAAVDRDRTFVLLSWQKPGSTFGADDVVRARLTSDTNLELSFVTGSLDGIADWQVVTMASASVQSGDVTLPGGSGSVTVPVSTVDTTRTFLLSSWTASADSIGANFIRGRISSPTQLTFDRGTTTPASTINLTWYLVTLNDGSTVQSGNAGFGADITGVPVVLTSPVHLNRAVAFLSGNQRGGRTPDSGTSPNDNPGVAWFRADLMGPTTLQVERATTSAAGGAGVTADAAWFVINFAGAAAVVGGDQTGRVYYVDAEAGAAAWTATLTGADTIQAATGSQLLAYANAGFKAASSESLVFAATRNTSSTNNKVFALRASDGTAVWTFNATGAYSMDYVVGTPWVDYARNRVYVASRAGAAGNQPSLWVLDSRDGTLVQSFSLGHLQSSPTLSWSETTLYVGNTAGQLYAVDLDTLALKWTSAAALGSALIGYVWEDFDVGGRLYFTTANGTVWCLQDPGPGAPPTAAGAVWQRAIAGASTPLLLDKLYVGSSDGRIHQIDPATGVVDTQFTVGDGTSTVGTPSTEDGAQVFVGTTAGTLYKIPLPLP
jgi:outer membrane protein assembly factor BamB